MKHLRPIAVDLFAGAGGLSLGLEQAGFDVAAAVEADPIHCAVHKFNFPRTAVIPRSVQGLTAAEIREAAGIGDRVVDCVVGGPPCQGFSMIGHRAIEDPRNRLVLEFVRIVSELNARSFVFENVKGLTVGNHKRFLLEIVEAFRSSGYEVRRPWYVLDAAYYGVPQHRERLILLGARQGEDLPEYPFPACNPADELRKIHPELPVGPCCKEALGDLPDVDNYDALLVSDAVAAEAAGKPAPYARMLRCEDAADWHFGHVRRWDANVLTSSARTVHSAISMRRFSETAPGGVEPISRFYRLPPNGLCNTLRAGTDAARGAFTSPRPIHYSHPRCITVREMARLHGFPDWFRFHSTKWHGARQVGNSVAPPLARAIGASILRALHVEPAKPECEIHLGDSRLLYLEMSEAAEHFGVAPPSSRRDRKSGAKKRKQHEIEIEREASRLLNV